MTKLPKVNAIVRVHAEGDDVEAKDYDAFLARMLNLRHEYTNVSVHLNEPVVSIPLYQQGLVSLDVGTLEQLGADLTDCTFGVDIHPDGRVWVCVNGATFLRFKPNGKAVEDHDHGREFHEPWDEPEVVDHIANFQPEGWAWNGHIERFKSQEPEA
jgi:hypothetical protein